MVLEAVLALMWPFLFTIAALIAAAALVPIRSFTLRHIPGPSALPFLGNLPQIMKTGSSVFYATCAAKYGSVFKIWFGRTPIVVVTDVKLIHAVGKMPDRSWMRHIFSTKDAELEVFGLATARDAIWRTTRTAWQPAFHPASLAAYFGLMDQTALQLVSHLSAVADAGKPVDIWRELGSMTLAVVGSTAYGVNFATIDAEGGTKGLTPEASPAQGSPLAAGAQQYGTALLNACQALFASSSIAKSSIYFKMNLMLPELNRVFSALAYAMPDKGFIALRQARSTIKSTSMELLRSSGLARGVDGGGGGGGAADAPVAGTPRAVGIAAGSFLGMLLSARDKSTMEGLSDAQVIAQATTFILAGYETTANALAFTIHGIASNPEVQTRLLAEVDAFGRERDVRSEDLEQFPYIAATLNESMRMYPPAPAVTRVSPVAVDLGGYSVPAGIAILLSFYSLHHDPAVWPEPERFLPERFLEADGPHSARVPGAHLPFGLGPRMCIGYKFAVREAVLTLVRLYQRYVFVLQPGQVPLALVNGITLAPKHGVNVTVQRR